MRPAHLLAELQSSLSALPSRQCGPEANVDRNRFGTSEPTELRTLLVDNQRSHRTPIGGKPSVRIITILIQRRPVSGQADDAKNHAASATYHGAASLGLRRAE